MNLKEFLKPTLSKIILSLILIAIPQYFIFTSSSQVICVTAPCLPSYALGWDAAQAFIAYNIVLAYLISSLIMFIFNKKK